MIAAIEASRVISLPDVGATIRAAFGLATALLTKKAVGDVTQS